MKLPKDVTAADFNAALDKFRRIVGAEWVFSSNEDVALYRDAYSPVWDEAEELLPSGAVAPATTEEVQAVVRVANQHRIPLFPISTGKNLGYGGSAPNMTGTLIVDLKRMNRILEVDEHRHFALVEPGVALGVPDAAELDAVVADAPGEARALLSTCLGQLFPYFPVISWAHPISQ